MSWGGARPGAGRKPKAQKYEAKINEAEKRIVDRLPDLVELELRLAAGDVAQVVPDITKERALRAGLVIQVSHALRQTLFPAGEERVEVTPQDCAAHANTFIRQLGIPEDCIICLQRPDRRAIEYLMSRIMGKPTERVEVEWPQERVEFLVQGYGEIVSRVLDEHRDLDPEVTATIKREVFDRYQREVIDRLP